MKLPQVDLHRRSRTFDLSKVGPREREAVELFTWAAVYTSSYLELTHLANGARQAVEIANEAIDRMRTALALRKTSPMTTRDLPPVKKKARVIR